MFITKHLDVNPTVYQVLEAHIPRDLEEDITTWSSTISVNIREDGDHASILYILWPEYAEKDNSHIVRMIFWEKDVGFSKNLYNLSDKQQDMIKTAFLDAYGIQPLSPDDVSQ
jgi:hypothetical protein